MTAHTEPVRWADSAEATVRATAALPGGTVISRALGFHRAENSGTSKQADLLPEHRDARIDCGDVPQEKE